MARCWRPPPRSRALRRHAGARMAAHHLPPRWPRRAGTRRLHHARPWRAPTGTGPCPPAPADRTAAPAPARQVPPRPRPPVRPTIPRPVPPPPRGAGCRYPRHARTDSRAAGGIRTADPRPGPAPRSSRWRPHGWPPPVAPPPRHAGGPDGSSDRPARTPDARWCAGFRPRQGRRDR